MKHFSVSQRDDEGHHWDIVDRKRLFAIRGEPGRVIVRDERTDRPAPSLTFTSLMEAMAWVCSTLMTPEGD